MSRYRFALPQLGPRPFLTDGGLETTLVFHEGVSLPHFAAFTLLGHREGESRLRAYYGRYLDIAQRLGTGAVLESATWRANPDWAARLGYDADALATCNRRAIELLVEIRSEHEACTGPIVISGNVGPRGDGYAPSARMSAAESADYHGAQIRTFAATAADMVAAFTLNYADEAVGIARAARDAGMPIAISFTVETDGRLPSGESLRGPSRPRMATRTPTRRTT